VIRYISNRGVQFYLFMKYLLVLFLILMAIFSVEAEEIEPVHYAYANYLGSGVYRTSNQDASLLSMPFSFEVGTNGQTSYGVRLPVSVGFFDFEFADIPELELPSSVGTLTFTPGVEFKYQHSKQLRIDSYVDFGYARNFTTDRAVSVYSTGVSALYDFTIGHYDSILANRIYYAAYSGNGYEAEDSYAALQIGIDTGFPLHYEIAGIKFQPRVFATAFWYFSEVDFVNFKAQSLDDEKNITLTNSFEAGFTLKFSETLGYSWAGIDRLGLSYRYSKNISVFRLLFSFPI
jgi:hypothetical protein